MALAATTVWEVRTAGSDTLCGGGFNPSRGGGGSDLTQQNAAQQTWDGVTNILSTSGAGSTTLTSNNSLFTSAMVGNVIQVTAGTNFQAGFYEITAFTNGTTVTLDRTPTSGGAGSAGAGAAGGALASPGQAGAAHVAGNTIWVASGTYAVTSASANVAGGCLTLAAGASAAAPTLLVGYGSTRGDGGTKPLLQAGTISTFTFVTMANATRAENVSVDGASKTSSRGFNAVFNCQLYRVKAANCTNTGFTGGSLSVGILCEATGCSGGVAAFISGVWWGCSSHDNTIPGFSVGSGPGIFFCVAANNTGATSDGFILSGGGGSPAFACTAYANGRDGFRVTAAAAGSFALVNCLAVNNLGFGYNASAQENLFYLYNCAGFNNSGGNVNTTVIPGAAQQIGFLALGSQPFNNAAGNDFSLNNVVGGGASLRAAGIPGSTAALQLPGLSTLSYPDVGAAQHQDPPAQLMLLLKA